MKIDEELQFFSGKKYLISAIICHSDHSVYGGHYFAFVKYNAYWIKIDDESISTITDKTKLFNRVASKKYCTAYVLLYEEQ